MIGMVIDGHWVRTWGITRDVTERMHLEEQLRNAQQLEAIGRLAGGVAHDFNNILSIIMGHGELLLADADVDERARNGLEQIRRAAERAASLTQQLLAFSRKQVLQPKVLDLNEAVADVQKMLSRVIGEDIELVAKSASVAGDGESGSRAGGAGADEPGDQCPRRDAARRQADDGNVERGDQCRTRRAISICRQDATRCCKVTDTGHGMDAGDAGACL